MTRAATQGETNRVKLIDVTDGSAIYRAPTFDGSTAGLLLCVGLREQLNGVHDRELCSF